MRPRSLLTLTLLLVACDAEPPPSTAPPAPAPSRVAPEPPPAPPPPRLTVAELEAVLEPARRDLAEAGLSPTLPLTFDEASDAPVLRRLADLLIDHTRITRVRIGAHTDPRGSGAYNLRVSQERAEAVARSLVDHGIGCQRIEAVGYGETRPIADAPRAAQRRIELTFARVDETPIGALGEDVCPR